LITLDNLITANTKNPIPCEKCNVVITGDIDPQKFSPSKNYFLAQNFLTNNAKCKAKYLDLWGIKVQIKILSTYNLLCQKFAAV